MDVLQVTLVRWGIGGSIRDYFDIVLRAFSMQASVGLTIEVEILTLPWAKALGLSNLTVERDSATVISQVINKERDPQKFDN